MRTHEHHANGKCSCCHKLSRFCTCPSDAVPTCPICMRPRSDGPHFPEARCRDAQCEAEGHAYYDPSYDNELESEYPRRLVCLRCGAKSSATREMN